VLYGWEMTSSDLPLTEYAERALARRRVADRYRPHIGRLLEVLEDRLPRVDRVLRELMPNWRLERLAVVDRNVLRIGAAEILYVDEVPGKVAISEGVSLAEKYGGKESPRFVNGVLDAVFREGAAVAGEAGERG
jgi:N utilization substance protein B